MTSLRIGIRRHRAFAIAVTLLASACASHDSASSAAVEAAPPLARTSAGTLSGGVENGSRVFKGIAYAAPPVGARRWKLPEPALPWDGVRPATTFGPACIQPSASEANVYARDIGPTSEDCLSVNVWTPPHASAAPVFVWIHGGSLRSGSGSGAMYDGARLAARGLVVVSINYRLGVLGYFAHPELSAESPQGISGNYGLYDQIAALQWVKDNIAAFGGDPGNVTIAGESAGALSVMYLMAAKPARGLFHKAILQSAYMISTPALTESVHGEFAQDQVGRYVTAKLGADDLAGLRAMDAQAVTDGAATLGFFPTGLIDGITFDKQLVETFERGEQAPVPVLVGFNSGEIRSLAFLAPPATSTTEYEATIRRQYLDLADAHLRLYPSSDVQESLFANTRDALYGWTSVRIAKDQTAIGQPAHLYYFDHGYPAADAAGLHGFHASEIPYVFGTFDKTPPRWPKNPDTPEEHAYANAIMGYWASFARDGSPRADGHPAWPAYGAEGRYLHFADDAPHPARELMPGMYELHEEAVRRRRAKGTQPWNWNTGPVSPVLAK